MIPATTIGRTIAVALGQIIIIVIEFATKRG